MPKTPTSKHDSAATTSGPMGSASHPNVLKRNQVRPQSSSSTVPHACLLGMPSMPQTQTRTSSFILTDLQRTFPYYRLRRNGNRPSNQRSTPHVHSCNSDAQKPCSTCVRSHAHALSHAPAGVVLPERPECTFDEGISLFTAFIECGVHNW